MQTVFNYNIKRLIIFAIQAIGIVVDIIALFFTENPPVCYTLLIIGTALFIIPLISSLVVLRCPSCHRCLYNEGIFFMDYCPYCGEKMYDDEYPKSKKK